MAIVIINDQIHTGGSTGGDNGAVQTSLSDNVHLNGGVTARVVHGTSVNLGDRHNEVMCLKDGWKSVSWKKKEEEGEEEKEENVLEKGDLMNGNAWLSRRRRGNRFTDDPK